MLMNWPIDTRIWCMWGHWDKSPHLGIHILHNHTFCNWCVWLIGCIENASESIQNGYGLFQFADTLNHYDRKWETFKKTRAHQRMVHGTWLNSITINLLAVSGVCYRILQLLVTGIFDIALVFVWWSKHDIRMLCDVSVTGDRVIWYFPCVCVMK